MCVLCMYIAHANVASHSLYAVLCVQPLSRYRKLGGEKQVVYMQHLVIITTYANDSWEKNEDVVARPFTGSLYL